MCEKMKTREEEAKIFFSTQSRSLSVGSEGVGERKNIIPWTWYGFFIKQKKKFSSVELCPILKIKRR